MMKSTNCIICKAHTLSVFNLGMKQRTVCDSCANYITKQQIDYLTSDNMRLPKSAEMQEITELRKKVCDLSIKNEKLLGHLKSILDCTKTLNIETIKQDRTFLSKVEKRACDYIESIEI